MRRLGVSRAAARHRKEQKYTLSSSVYVMARFSVRRDNGNDIRVRLKGSKERKREDRWLRKRRGTGELWKRKREEECFLVCEQNSKL